MGHIVKISLRSKIVPMAVAENEDVVAGYAVNQYGVKPCVCPLHLSHYLSSLELIVMAWKCYSDEDVLRLLREIELILASGLLFALCLQTSHLIIICVP